MNMLVNQYLLSLPESWMTIVNQWLLRRSNLRAGIASGELELQWNDTDISMPVLVIRFKLLEHQWAIALQNLSAIDARLHGEPFMLMPEALRTFTLQKIIAEFLAQFSPAMIANINSATIEWSLADELASWKKFPFDLKNLTQHTQTNGLLLVEKPHTLQWLTENLPFAPVKKIGLSQSLDIHTKLHFGVTRLRLSQVKDLVPGDLIWIEKFHQNKRGLQVSFDVSTPKNSITFQGYWKHNALTVTEQTAGRASLHVESNHYFSERSAMHIEIDQLELPVAFDLGDLSFPIAEIERIAPDYIFELPCEVSDAVVNLRINGKLIAQGSLVTVGRRLAVRVTHICASENKETINESFKGSTEEPLHI